MLQKHFMCRKENRAKENSWQVPLTAVNLLIYTISEIPEGMHYSE